MIQTCFIILKIFLLLLYVNIFPYVKHPQKKKSSGRISPSLVEYHPHTEYFPADIIWPHDLLSYNMILSVLIAKYCCLLVQKINILGMTVHIEKIQRIF